MLNLIGLGLDEREITLKALDVLRDADSIFVEFYTNTVQDLSWLEAELGKEIVRLERLDVEQPDTLLTAAAEGNTVLLVSGDPVTATTHMDLVQQAREQDIETNIIHAPSIFTSVAETGLSLYKFGRTVTLPRPQKGYFPTSPYEQLAANHESGLHTLVLLDIDLDAHEALSILTDLEEQGQENIIATGTSIIVVERMNTETQEITFGSLTTLRERKYGAPPHAIIVPGNIDEKEREFLEPHLIE